MPQLRSPAIRLALGGSSLSRAAVGGAVLIVVAVWTFRWLSMGALENDHFVALARAHQLLHGAWPVRDFADPGQPLTYLLSAGAAWLFGATLRTDVIVAITLLSLAAALTYSLAARASGSLLIAAAAVAVEVAAAPRLYNAGKVLIPLAAVGLGWRYADAPSRLRLVALAAWTAIACLWRHDFIVYVAAPVLVLLALSHERSRAARLGLLYLAATLGLLLPWLIYVQWAGGLADYLGAAFRFATTEAQRTVVWPGQAWAAFAAITAIPVVAIVLARRSAQPLSFVHVAFAASIALVSNVVLLRDVITTRLPDVIGLTAILGAWLAARVIPARALRPIAGAALVVVGAIVVSTLMSQGYGIPTPAKVARRFAVVSEMLRKETADAIPNRERLPLIRYVASCTPTASRVLVSGFGPEIPVLAHRPFAAGLPSWIPGYSTHPRDVERASAQLSRESVSIAVLLEGSAVFVEEWPRLAADLRARHFIERTWRLDGRDVVVWIPADVGERAPDTPPACER
jgi:hypothetical protein